MKEWKNKIVEVHLGKGKKEGKKKKVTKLDKIETKKSIK
jgi:hypothetical protein